MASLAVLATPLLLLIALTSWAFSSPIGSSPDDNFHLSSIWCGQGIRQGICEEADPKSTDRMVPRLILAAGCFALNSDQSAGCQLKEDDPYAQGLAPATYWNSSGLYPPGFYFVTSGLVDTDILLSVLRIRIFNALLAVGIFLGTYFLIGRSLRRPFVWAAVICAVPLALFFIPSTNPTSWGLISASAFWVSCIAYFQATTARGQVGLASWALLVGLIGSSARSDIAAFNLLTLATVSLVESSKMRRDRRLFFFPGIFSVLTLYLFLGAGQSSSLLTGLNDGSSSASGLSGVSLIAANLLLVPSIWVGMFGTIGLGWEDTPMPVIVWLPALGSFIGLMFWAAHSKYEGSNGRSRKSIAVGIQSIAMVTIPTVMLVQSNALVGQYVQPRYLLPLLIVLAGMMLFGTSGAPINLAQKLFVVVALSIAQSFALFVNTRRYVTGNSVLSPNLDQGADWWWSSYFFSPAANWHIGTVAFALLLAILFFRPLETKPARIEST
jgi:hypothetical protein